MSESDAARSGEQRTIDFPPIVPARSSSLSAPTSRNGSRNVSRRESLTADSLRSHNAQLAQLDLLNANNALEQLQAPESRASLSRNHVLPARDAFQRLPKPAMGVRLSATQAGLDQPALEAHDDDESGGDMGLHRLPVDGLGDPWFEKRPSFRATPFSQVSMETAGTSQSHAEVSEALMVNIYPHQNKSLVMVDHLAGRSAPERDQRKRDALDSVHMTAPNIIDEVGVCMAAVPMVLLSRSPLFFS